MFYLANDVVQSCKKKNAKIYLLAFKNVLKDAVVLVRDAAVKHKIERIFHIWEERNTYFIDFVNELRELLSKFIIDPSLVWFDFFYCNHVTLWK